MAFQGMKLVAVLDVHNETSALIADFKGTCITELVSHPTCEGVALVRFRNDTVETQLDKFGRIHSNLKAHGGQGFDAALMLDSICAAPSEWPVFHAGMKQVDPAIKTLLLAYGRSLRQPVTADVVQTRTLTIEPSRWLKNQLGIAESYEIPEDRDWISRQRCLLDAAINNALATRAPRFLPGQRRSSRPS